MTVLSFDSIDIVEDLLESFDLFVLQRSKDMLSFM